jgi:subtilisin family serine protease
MGSTSALQFTSAITLSFLCALAVQAQMVVDLDTLPSSQVPEERTHNSGQYIVTFEPSTGRSQRAQIAQQVGADVRFNYTVINGIAISVGSDQALNALRNNPRVAGIFQDGVVQDMAKPQAPAAPGTLTGDASSGVFNLNWVDNSSNEVGFRVERCDGAGCTPGTVVGTVSSDTTAFTDNTVSAGMVYAYRIIAYVESGPSKYSAPSNTYEEMVGDTGGPPSPPPPTASVWGARQLIPIGVQRTGVPVSGSSDGAGIGIAVVDSGIDFNQPDLIAVDAYNAQNPGASAQDDRGHGTHVAGIINAQDNNIGVVGVAPAATLYAVKVLDMNGTATDSEVIMGLDWIWDNYDSVAPPIRIVNMSLGGLPDTNAGETVLGSPMHMAVQQLYNAGIVVVAAAGNSPTAEVSEYLPAGLPESIAVAGSVAESGASDAACGVAPQRADTAGWVTTDGAYNTATRIGVTVSAPSEERHDVIYDGLFSCSLAINGVRSTLLMDPSSAADPNSIVSGRVIPGVGEAIGTSFAAPHVTGAVARIMQLGLVPATGDAAEVEGIRDWLRANADRRDSASILPAGLDAAPLDQLLNTEYSFDGEREGIAQAPYAAP